MVRSSPWGNHQGNLFNPIAEWHCYRHILGFMPFLVSHVKSLIFEQLCPHNCQKTRFFSIVQYCTIFLHVPHTTSRFVIFDFCSHEQNGRIPRSAKTKKWKWNYLTAVFDWVIFTCLHCCTTFWLKNRKKLDSVHRVWRKCLWFSARSHDNKKLYPRQIMAPHCVIYILFAKIKRISKVCTRTKVNNFSKTLSVKTHRVSRTDDCK